jgi:PleD family two-component response regulator
MTSRESYHQAKIEHFARRASEFIRMGRYAQARKTVDAILAMDGSSEEGKGLRSRIEAALADLREARNSNGDGHGRSRRRELVLCVDQDERVLAGLGITLRRHGYRSLGAASYDEATEVLENLVPDVVVSEVNFAAGPRGFDLFLWMRTNPSYKEIPFLFHATRIDREVLIAGKRFGVDDFIVKPADGEVVAAAVAQTLLRRKHATPA